MSLNSLGKRLKYIRSLLRLTRAHIEEKYSLPEVTLKSWENETVQLTPKGLKRCLEIYRTEGLIVSEDWILEGVGLNPMASLTIAHYFSTPTQKELPKEDDEICMLQEANSFKESYQNAVIMMVSNDEMRPFYKPGDYVGGKMRYGEAIETTINKDSIVHLQDNERYFRRVVKNSLGLYNLVCLNPNENTAEPVLYNVKIKGVAPVIWHRRQDE